MRRWQKHGKDCSESKKWRINWSCEEEKEGCVVFKSHYSYNLYRLLLIVYCSWSFIIPSKSLLFCFWALNVLFFLFFVSFSFHFCHVWLKISCFSTSRLFYSTSVLYLSTSVVFCFFCLIQFPSWFFYFPYHLRAFTPPPPSPPILWYFLTLQCIRLLRATTWHYQRILKKSYTNGVISMWNPFTNAFPLASQSYSLNVKVVIYVPPFVSIFSTLLHGCCCFY